MRFRVRELLTTGAVLGLAFTASGQVVLDFEDAPPVQDPSATPCYQPMPDLLRTRGFVLSRSLAQTTQAYDWDTIVGQVVVFSGSNADASPDFPGQCALEYCCTRSFASRTEERPPRTYLFREDGATFDLMSMDLRARTAGERFRFAFLGYKPDGTLIAAYDNTTSWQGYINGFAPYVFPAGLRGVDMVEIGSSAEQTAMLDNIRIENIGPPRPLARMHTIDFERPSTGNYSSFTYRQGPFVVRAHGEQDADFAFVGPGDAGASVSRTMHIAGPLYDAHFLVSRVDRRAFALRSFEVAFHWPSVELFFDPAPTGSFSARVPIRLLYEDGTFAATTVTHTVPDIAAAPPLVVRYDADDLAPLSLQGLIGVKIGIDRQSSISGFGGDSLALFQLDNIVLEASEVCVGDFNRSGGVTVQDIFDFLAAYFEGFASADVNGQGGVTVQDIFDFLNAYFAGCGF